MPSDPQPLAPQLPKTFSPSAADTVEQCLRKWYAQRVLKLPDPQGPEARIGTMAHSVLEHLSKVPDDLRNENVAAGMAARLWPHDTPRRKNLAWAQVLNALQSPVILEARPLHVERRLQVPLAGVPFRGHPDRIDLIDEPDGPVAVVDYKTGERKVGPKGSFLLPKRRQVTLYAAAVEAADDVTVARAELYWTRCGTIDSVPISEASIDVAVSWFVEMWEKLETAIKTGKFPANPGALCSWCPACVEHCPEGRLAVLARADAGKSIGHHGQKILNQRLNTDLERSLIAAGRKPPREEP